MAADAVAAEERSHGKLRRELRFWEAIALSIGIMAPTAAMALNGVAPAGLVGRAVPLAFLFAAIAIGLISYSFVRLTRFFNHAGSTYALAGATLGPRAGFFAGWALLGGRVPRPDSPHRPRPRPSRGNHAPRELTQTPGERSVPAHRPAA